LFHYEDMQAAEGKQYYALIASSGEHRSRQTYAMASVPKSSPVPVPKAMTAVSLLGKVKLQWTELQDLTIRFNVYRAPVGSNDFEKLNASPLPIAEYSDVSIESNVSYRYVVHSINRRGIESPPSEEIVCHAMPKPKKPVVMETVK
jgi:fibronectin type 3 domain-containing protein